MANYDNSRYTYSSVLNGTGYYKQDDSLIYSAGVKTMQEKLNKAGFWCGTPDGKFGGGTDEAVRHFQRAYNLTADGAAGQYTLAKLDIASANSPGFTKTSGTYGVYFDNTNKRFLHNQQVVYERLKSAGLSNVAIAGFILEECKVGQYRDLYLYEDYFPKFHFLLYMNKKSVNGIFITKVIYSIDTFLFM